MAEEKELKLFDYDQQKGCFFYEKDKSYEDAYPYIDESLLVVCDGSGGAGGYKHEVEPKKINSLEKIKELVLPEDDTNFMDEYLKTLFEPIYNEPEVSRTSAFWASRIVIPRFVYYWKKMDHDIEKAKEFIIEGMQRVVDKLHFKQSDKSDKGLLPTTFVAISLEKEDDKKVYFDVYWAGDSRAYYLSKEGMKMLSIDNEDASGSITNLFIFKEGFEIKICHRHYELDKPCALLVCSDGLFDICSNVGFEGNFLAVIERSDVDDIQEFSDALALWYSTRKSDDCTLAFKLFGFNSFQEVKDEFKDRYAYVYDLFVKLHNYQNNLAIREDTSLYESNFKRLVTRTSDKFDDISNTLSSLILEKKEDPVIDKSMKDMMSKANKQQIENKQKEKKENVSKAISMTREYCLANYQTLDLFAFFNKERIPSKYLNKLDQLQGEGNRVKEIKDKQRRLNAMMSTANNGKGKKGEFVVMIQQLSHKVEHLRDNLLYKAFDSKRIPMSVKLNKNIKDSDLERLLDVVNVYEPDPEFKEKFLRLFVEYKDLRSFLAHNQLQDSKPQELGEEYKAILADFFTIKDEALLDMMMESTPLEDVNALLAKIRGEDVPVDINEFFKQFFKETYNNKDGYETIVLSRLEAGDNKSAIDVYYNQNLLETTIKYHQVVNVKDPKFEEFLNEYKKFNDNAESLIK